MSTLSAKLSRLNKSKGFKYGLPFLILIVGGSFGLKEFAKIRYQFSKKKLVDPAEMQKLGVTMRDPKDITLEKEYEKVSTLDLDNWTNKRGPRPWEENFSQQ